MISVLAALELCKESAPTIKKQRQGKADSTNFNFWYNQESHNQTGSKPVKNIISKDQLLKPIRIKNSKSTI